jgi:hypothetical protein
VDNTSLAAIFKLLLQRRDVTGRQTRQGTDELCGCARIVRIAHLRHYPKRAVELPDEVVQFAGKSEKSASHRIIIGSARWAELVERALSIAKLSCGVVKAKAPQVCWPCWIMTSKSIKQMLKIRQSVGQVLSAQFALVSNLLSLNLKSARYGEDSTQCCSENTAQKAQNIAGFHAAKPRVCGTVNERCSSGSSHGGERDGRDGPEGIQHLLHKHDPRPLISDFEAGFAFLCKCWAASI